MKVITMRGHELDMSALIAQNSNKVAIGNASMNARGDLVRGGKVVKPREQVAMEYHENNPKAVRSMGIKALAGEIFASPAEAVAAHRDKLAPKDAPKAKRKLVDAPDDDADL